MILVSFLNTSITAGTLFFIPVLFFTAVSRISLKELHILVRQKGPVKLLLSISTLLGIVLAMNVSVPLIVYDALLGFIVGSMLHIIIMDAIPKEREGNPAYFVLGVVIYILLITLTWIF
jgi:hypothetical protein